MKKLKQLFCEHIWKQIKIEPIRAYRVTMFDGLVPKGEIHVSAITYECLKCGKKKIKEEEVRRDYITDDILDIERAKRGLPKIGY